MMNPSKMQSRVAALALLLVTVVAGLWLMFYPVVSLHVAQAEEIERKERQLTRFHQLADSQEALQRELATLRRRNPAASYYVAGETPAIASANMQQYLKQVVERNGGELISTQILTADGDGAAQSSSLKVHLRGNIESSAQIVYLLESGRPLLFIDELSISARRVRGKTAGAPPEIALDLNFELTGYIKEGV